MTDWPLPLHASCLCGQVQMQVTAPPLISMACHCKGCQKLTSGAYSLTLMIPGEGFKVTAGEPEIGALHRAESQHHYCPRCKSWLYTTAPGLQGAINFRPTMLEDASWVVPFIESWVSEKLPGAATGATHSFKEFPPREHYPSLIAEFSKSGARPS